MGKSHLLVISLLFFCCCVSQLRGESASVGRGGPYIQYHVMPLSNFDAELSGNPLVIGGVGFATVSRNFRLGGGGGGGFLWNGSNNVTFGMGYGGVVGELGITTWLNARLMIGGGGYAVAKIVSETISERTLSKVNSDGFLLFLPSLHFDFPIHNWLKFSASLGYFLPNNSRLHSVTIGVGLLFGKI